MRRPLILIALALGLGGCGDEVEGAPTWTTDWEHEPAALLSIHADDRGVIAVGVDDGSGSLVLERNASGTWDRTDVGTTGDLWWVAPDGDEALLLCGEAGLLVELDRTGGQPVVKPPPTDATLYGAWVAEDGRAWAVGGDVAATNGRGVLLVRGPEGTWAPDPSAPPSVLDASALFKVWGRHASDVWVVGEHGTVLHYDGGSWTQVDAPTSTRLLTVHGQGDTGPYAVGGAGNGVILELEGNVLVDRSPEFVPSLNGVFVLDDHAALAVGNRGLIADRSADGWSVLEQPPTGADLHAVAARSPSEAWAVGGALTSATPDQGTILRLGR